MKLLLIAIAAGQLLTQPLAPERTLNTSLLFGFPLSIVDTVEADGILTTEDFLLRDDVRETGATNLYYVASLRADGTIWCSPGAHPEVMLPAHYRYALTPRLVAGRHKLFRAVAKGIDAQYPLPTVTYRCY